MPVIPLQPVEPRRSVLIVGNGPSRQVVRWTAAYREIRQQQREDLQLLLINYNALGRTTPDYAVAVGPEVLAEYQAKQLHKRTLVITNAPHKIMGPEDAASRIGALLLSENLLVGLDEWPPHASGPIALWAMTRMGYGRIYLYGLDGSVPLPSTVPITEEHTDSRTNGPRRREPTAEQITSWEVWLRRFQMSRGNGDGSTVTLVRVWPDERWRNCKDPLACVLDETFYVRRQEEAV